MSTTPKCTCSVGWELTDEIEKLKKQLAGYRSQPTGTADKPVYFIENMNTHQWLAKFHLWGLQSNCTGDVNFFDESGKWTKEPFNAEVYKTKEEAQAVIDKFYFHPKIFEVTEHIFSSPSQPIGWLPIETAPKDGSKILVIMPDGEIYLVKWFEHVNTWVTYPGLIHIQLPAHWMPLPSAPGSEPLPGEQESTFLSKYKALRDVYIQTLSAYREDNGADEEDVAAAVNKAFEADYMNL